MATRRDKLTAAKKKKRSARAGSAASHGAEALERAEAAKEAAAVVVVAVPAIPSPTDDAMVAGFLESMNTALSDRAAHLAQVKALEQTIAAQTEIIATVVREVPVADLPRECWRQIELFQTATAELATRYVDVDSLEFADLIDNALDAGANYVDGDESVREISTRLLVGFKVRRSSHPYAPPKPATGEKKP